VAVVGAGNKITIRAVQVGEQVGTEWVITKGLQAGDRVVAEGTEEVHDGMVVNPKPYVAAKAN
jgi:membrane fusion protein, multidrug efflux system